MNDTQHGIPHCVHGTGQGFQSGIAKPLHEAEHWQWRDENLLGPDNSS